MKYISFLLSAFITLVNGNECNIAIDIGHSPSNQGAISSSGVGEYYYNKRLAIMLHNELNKKGIKNFFVNNTEKEISLIDRSKAAKKYKATHFISIHHDSFNKKYFSNPDDIFGYSVFISNKNKYYDQSYNLALNIAKNISIITSRSKYHELNIPGENKKLLNDFGVYEYNNLVVLKSNNIPSVLVENGVITNKKENILLQNPKYHNIIAKQISLAFFKICI